MKFRVWTDADTEHGRDLLEAALRSRSPADLEAFYEWVDANVYVTLSLVRETIDRCFDFRDAGRALKLYDAMMLGYDPIAHVVRACIKLAVATVLLGAIAGGFLYFVRALWGSP